MNRPSLLANIPAAIKHAKLLHEAKAAGQSDLFGGMQLPPPKMIELPDWNQATKLYYEREALGTFVSSHPVELCREKWQHRVTHKIAQRDEMMQVSRGDIVIAGFIEDIKVRPRITIMSLSDFSGRTEIISFNDEMERYAYAIRTGYVVAMKLSPRYGDRYESLQMLKAHKLMDFDAMVSK